MHAPMATVMEASVTTNGIMPRYATATPFTAPTARAAASMTTAPGKGSPPLRMTRAPRTALSATLAEMDRSIPPPTMT